MDSYHNAFDECVQLRAEKETMQAELLVTDADLVPTQGSKSASKTAMLCVHHHHQTCGKGAKCKFFHLTPSKMFEVKLINESDQENT